MNPFKYGQIVSGKDFCPRPQLEKQIKDFINSGQNLLIQGERRVGKTSLICETINKIKKKSLLYIDLLEVKSVDNLCKRLVKAIVTLEQKKGLLEKIIYSISHLRPVVSIDPITNQPTVSLGQDITLHPDSLEGIFDLIKKLHDDDSKSIIVVFDEFQDILNLKEYKEVLAIIRGRIQFHSSIPYIFSGSIRNKMHVIFNDSESPLFKSAITIEVGNIETKLFIDYIREKLLKGNHTIEDSVLIKIFEMAERITGDIQQFCNALWEITSRNEAISDEHISRALKLIFARESKSYEIVLTTTTDLQLRCLTGLARMGGKAPLSKEFLKNIGNILPASIQKSLIRLEQLKIIYKKNSEYKFVNPFFKLWLLSNNLF